MVSFSPPSAAQPIITLSNLPPRFSAYPVTEVAGQLMRELPGGPFVMGNDRFCDAELGWVKLDPFRLDITPRTEGSYGAIMGRVWDKRGRNSTPLNHPVANVNWRDAEKYMHLVNAQTPRGQDQIRFPTEAEQEYAMRFPRKVREFMDEQDLRSAQQLVEYV